MTFVQSLSRMALGLGIVALAACQTVPQEQAPADADEQAQTVVEPSEELSEEQQAALDQAEYSPLLVFLADFEPQDDWVEVALEDDTALYLRPEPSFTRDDLMSVETYASESGEGLLALFLTDAATERLSRLTTEHPDQRLALAVDGTLLAAPRYSEPLTNGRLVFMVGSVENAELAARLIAGEEAVGETPRP